MFKTTNIGSFIRQLNLYGFRKLNVVRFAETTPDMREVHEFQNDFFHRGRPDLLAYLKRNVGIRRTRDLAVKRRFETMESGSAAKHPRYAPQVYLSASSFDQETTSLFKPCSQFTLIVLGESNFEFRFRSIIQFSQFFIHPSIHFIHVKNWMKRWKWNQKLPRQVRPFMAHFFR